MISFNGIIKYQDQKTSENQNQKPQVKKSVLLAGKIIIAPDIKTSSSNQEVSGPLTKYVSIKLLPSASVTKGNLTQYNSSLENIKLSNDFLDDIINYLNETTEIQSRLTWQNGMLPNENHLSVTVCETTGNVDEVENGNTTFPLRLPNSYLYDEVVKVMATADPVKAIGATFDEINEGE